MAQAMAIHRYGGTNRQIKKWNMAAAGNGGDVLVDGDRLGVVAQVSPYAIGDDVTLQVDGVKDMAATSGDTWSDGARLYWNDSTKALTSTAATNKTAGLAVGAKGAGVTRALCDLNAATGGVVA